MSSSPSPLSRASKGCKAGRGARFGNDARLLEERMGNRDGHIGDIRRPDMPLPPSRQDDKDELASSLAEILIADFQQYPSIMGHTAKNPGGFNRKSGTSRK